MSAVFIKFHKSPHTKPACDCRLYVPWVKENILPTVEEAQRTVLSWIVNFELMDRFDTVRHVGCVDHNVVHVFHDADGSRTIRKIVFLSEGNYLEFDCDTMLKRWTNAG